MKELESVLQDRFELVFTDKSLLETAFTHTSYANEHRLLKISHNERLEFLGDAVLQLLVLPVIVSLTSLSSLVRGRKSLVAVTEIRSWGMPSKPFWVLCF